MQASSIWASLGSYVELELVQLWHECMRPLLQLCLVMQTGNSPTMISKAMLAELLPRWDRTVRAIHADLEADKALGWAQEMFAFSLALANAPAGPPKLSIHQELMAQPPFDQKLVYDKCNVCSICTRALSNQ